MPGNTRRGASLRRRRSAGFSLIEMVVAMAILGLALGALYQAASGATRNVRSDQRYAYAVELARSLLADNSVTPVDGVNVTGETNSGFRWRVLAEPISRERGSAIADGALQDLEVVVSWRDGTRERSVTLYSVVAGLP